MNKIIKSLLVAAVLAVPVLMTSCDKDMDSNPTLSVPGSFVLNTPPLEQNNVYDLANSEYVHLTCSQPNYGGFPTATTYVVSVSLDQNNWEELTSRYTTCSMNVVASEINDAVVRQYLAQGHDEANGVILPVYVRLMACIPGGTSSSVEHGKVYSNIIKLSNVKATYVAPAVSLPTELFLCGSCISDAWSTWKPMAPVYGMEGEFYSLIYSDGTGQFKWGTYANEWLNYGAFATINDNANAGVQDADGDNHNILLSNPGWYVIYITSKVSGKHVDYTLNIEKGAAGVVGNAFDPDWGGIAMDVPADGGEWTSPVAVGSGEMRAYITVPGRDWWRTEFTFHKGAMFFRTVDIPENWGANVGADYSVNVNAGQKAKFNFDKNTGYVE